MSMWPKLSETLMFERAPHICQACGQGGSIYWVECDDRDRPTDVQIVLCEECENSKLVEKHPRLYIKSPRNKPCPGAMACCVDCAHRIKDSGDGEGLICGSPMLVKNGGPGLRVHHSKPNVVHVLTRRGGFWLEEYLMPPTCEGREPA